MNRYLLELRERAKGRKSNIPLTAAEVKEIAVTTADEVMERVREREHDSLMLHSIPSAFGSPGIVVDEALAKATPCRCMEYKPGKKLCFSKGIVGALSDEQEEIYCPTVEELVSPGLERRLKHWMGAVDVCKAEIKPIPKGERLEPWLSCMSRELETRGIEASESNSSNVERYLKRAREMAGELETVKDRTRIAEVWSEDKGVYFTALKKPGLPRYGPTVPEMTLFIPWKDKEYAKEIRELFRNRGFELSLSGY